jgi:hypothetical protein
MWSFTKKVSFSQREDDSDEESKTGLLSQTPQSKNQNANFRLHAGFAFLHAIIAMLWLSTIWTYALFAAKSLRFYDL